MLANNEKLLCQSTEPAGKAACMPMSEQQKLEAVAHLTDDVLAALTKAFFEVVKREQWGKRDLAQISGLNETAIGHILAGRRKNLTIETIALLARAMQKRPELVLHDLRPHRNHSTNPNEPIGRRLRSSRLTRAAGSSAS
jgi:transcriptional regulator with XRE-family HTH domain